MRLCLQEQLWVWQCHVRVRPDLVPSSPWTLSLSFCPQHPCNCRLTSHGQALDYWSRPIYPGLLDQESQRKGVFSEKAHTADTDEGLATQLWHCSTKLDRKQVVQHLLTGGNQNEFPCGNDQEWAMAFDIAEADSGQFACSVPRTLQTVATTICRIAVDTYNSWTYN